MASFQRTAEPLGLLPPTPPFLQVASTRSHLTLGALLHVGLSLVGFGPRYRPPSSLFPLRDAERSLVVPSVAGEVGAVSEGAAVPGHAG